jgi:hypothetical protein
MHFHRLQITAKPTSTQHYATELHLLVWSGRPRPLPLPLLLLLLFQAATIVSPGAALAATLFADKSVRATRNLAAQNTRRLL